MEVDSLFENLTIKEIRQQNIKTRTEIERKKEELRFLVSERYRDIIDTADTIFEIKTRASEINESLKRINDIYKDWNNLIMHKPINRIPIDKDLEKKQQKLSLIAQIKLILNMSELIWNALETKQFSKAAMLFNICRNMFIHSKFVSDKYKEEKLDLAFIFNRHWSSLTNLERTIGLVCRKYLKSTTSYRSPGDILNCLLGILLLEDQNIDFVLREYLESVEYQIQEWFSPKNSYVPINQQLKSIAEIIIETISNVYELFMKNSIINRLEDLSRIQVQDMDSTQEKRIYHHLPDGISLFRPAQKSFQQNSSCMKAEDIIKITNNWLQNCRSKYKSSFVSSFKYLVTVKSVGEVLRDLESIFDRVADNSLQIEEWRELEDDNSKGWKIMIKNIYSVKLKEIIEVNISTLFSNWCKSIENFMDVSINLLNENEFDLDSFLNYFWTEFNKDVFFHSESSLTTCNISENTSSICKMVFESLYYHFLNFFDVGQPASNKSCSFDSLIVKFKVIRPEIHQITKIFNTALFRLISEFIYTINDDEEFLWIILKECLVSIIDRCVNWTNKLVSNDYTEFNQSINILKNEKFLYDFKNEGNNIITSYQLKMIILSQSLRTIYELLPSLQAGLMTSVFNSENIKSPFSKTRMISKMKSKNSRLPFLPGKRINHQQELESAMWTIWNETIDSLKKIVDLFVINGIKSSISNFISGYFVLIKHGFSSVESCEEICTKWMPMNFDNSGLNSGMSLPLQVPVQCSWPMHILLFNISHLLSIFGAHSITSQSNDGIRLQILITVIDNFKTIQGSDEFQDNKFLQKQNIQLIFDIRFLLEILNAKAGIEKDIQDNLRSVLNEIEKRVDPFDYEMMSEALYQNLTQNIAKNASIYWLLSSSQSKKYSSFGQKLEIGSSQHNLIELVGSSTGKMVKSTLRFAMLPVSGFSLTDKNYVSNCSKQPSKIENKIKSVPSIDHVHSKSDFRKDPNFNLNMQTSSKSYFGRLGTNWF